MSCQPRGNRAGLHLGREIYTHTPDMGTSKMIGQRQPRRLPHVSNPAPFYWAQLSLSSPVCSPACSLLLCSRSVVSNSLWPHGLWPSRLLCPWGFSRQGYWNGPPCPPPGILPNPGIEPRSPTLWADSLPAEPPGKPMNTGVGSLSLLQGIFPTQKSNLGLLHCREILYQLSYQGSLSLLLIKPFICFTVLEIFAEFFLQRKGLRSCFQWTHSKIIMKSRLLGPTRTPPSPPALCHNPLLLIMLWPVGYFLYP